ncbi:MAG TPA: UvrD-helicase domain-containing protein [Vicinamibacterales bacterium]|nr:UvrD-helicase domain-containing protein [Vicinamibacterales bacterium]
MSTVMTDAEARLRIEHALDETLVVEAAAGTGKTTELVKRILRLLGTGRATVDRLVAVTFTEKAAGELKLRLRQELESRRKDSEADPADRERYEVALQNLEDAHVSTIHGFCAELLRERPVEAGIDPLFRVLTEAQAQRLYDEAFATWLQRALAEMPEGVRRSLRRSSRSIAGAEMNDAGPVDRLRAAGWDLVEWRDFTAAWERPAFAREAVIRALAEAVHAFAATTLRPSSVRDPLYVDTAAARRISDELRLILGAEDLDAAEGVLVDLGRDRDFRRARKGSGAMFAKGSARADVYAAHQALIGELDAFRFDADADLAALLREELRGSIDEYRRLKARHGALDFLDLLLRARDLVRDREDVRRDFQERFACLLVDEFQDTDPLQAEILLLLSSDDPQEDDWRRVRPHPGKLFIVGDPKQSIYRFRRADVGIYRDVCERLSAQGARTLELTTSFRSVPGIQRVVNAAFASRMTGDVETMQASYVGLAPSREAIADQPAVIALPVPEPYGKRNISGAAIDLSLPDAVGALVHWLVSESHWMVSDRRGGRRPIEPRHICLLFRRFVNFGADVTRAYVDALEARGIKHLLVGGRAFHGREEIETLRAALAAIEWPDDQLSVFATLRGALFAIGDEELLEYHHRCGKRFHPFAAPDELPEHLAPIGDALRLLATLHRQRNRKPVADTIMRLFAETRAHVGFALRRAGEQVLANALHVAELARQYELSGGISFRGFVEELREAAENGQAAEAPIVEEGSDGVRLMTVHKAKGLEFPVVILADMTAKLAPLDASRHLDPARDLCALRIGGWSPRDLLLHQAIEQAREREEGVRVAYVAATRARDLLVVPSVGDAPFEGGWTSPLDAAIYPAMGARREARAASGCPAFRRDSVLRRPDGGIASSQTVSPGLHRFESDPDAAYGVVWWDPSALHLGVEPPFGLRRQELIARDVAPEVVAAGQLDYIAWRDSRAAAIAAGARPSLDVRTVSESVASAADERTPAAVETIAFDTVPGGPSGPRYGTLVHAVFAAIPLDANLELIRTVTATQARGIGATSDEQDAAAHAVHRALQHEVFEAARRADAAGRCLRETPVTLTAGAQLTEGIVDFVFTDDHGMTVIDFKTDRAEGERLQRYRQQIALYAEALARVSGAPVRAVLMKV